MLKLPLLLTIATASLFSLEIVLEKSVSSTITPDVLYTSISYNKKSDDENIIKRDLNAIILEMKNFDKDAKYCGGGGYNLYPEYKYVDNTREFIGYRGNLNFNCEFDNINSYNTLIKTLDSVTAPDIEKNFGTLNLKPSDRLLEQTRANLELEILKTSSQISKKFSSQLAQKCIVKKIDYRDNHPVAVRAMMASSDFVSTEAPIAQSQKVALNAQITLECR